MQGGCLQWKVNSITASMVEGILYILPFLQFVPIWHNSIFLLSLASLAQKHVKMLSIVGLSDF